ncbi:MAG: DoxX family protein [Deltaproteobacteria bacterium]|nr:MAG: DoxX family protein [Deltaproteobacteria bacterium]
MREADSHAVRGFRRQGLPGLPSGLDKIKHRQQALQQASSGPLPDPRLLIDVGAVVETVAPLCIVTGKFDRPAAAVLAGFCAVTAVGYHQFWTYDDLRAPGKSKGREEMWEFLKNFGLVGGLLMVAFPKRTRS